MSMESTVEILTALIVIIAVALEIQIIRINKKLGDLAARDTGK